LLKEFFIKNFWEKKVAGSKKMLVFLFLLQVSFVLGMQKKNKLQEKLVFKIERDAQTNERTIHCTITNTANKQIQFKVEDKNGIMSAFYDSRANKKQSADRYFKNVHIKENNIIWEEFEPQIPANFIDKDTQQDIKNGKLKGVQKKFLLLPKKNSITKRTGAFANKHILLGTLYSDKAETTETRHKIHQKTFNFMHHERLLILLAGIVHEKTLKLNRNSAPQFAYQTRLATGLQRIKKYVGDNLGDFPYEFASYKNQLSWTKDKRLDSTPSYDEYRMLVKASYIRKK